MTTDGILSGRERQVIGLLADGLTQVEAAERLGLSPRTVEGYVARAAHKLGTRTAAQTVAVALIRRAIPYPVNRPLTVREAVRVESDKARRR